MIALGKTGLTKSQRRETEDLIDDVDKAVKMLQQAIQISFLDQPINEPLEAFFASIGSLRRTDLRPIRPRIEAPVLAVYGARDNVVDPGQWKVLQPRLTQLRTVLFPSAGHFPMLDEPARFLRHLGSFLDALAV